MSARFPHPRMRKVAELIAANERRQHQLETERLFQRMYEFGISSLNVHPDKAKELAEIAIGSAGSLDLPRGA
jgi:hypothetical protein